MVCNFFAVSTGGSPIAVNVLKGKMWNEQSEFDASKDKTHFRQYETACDRVRAFYHEQHGSYYFARKALFV